MSTKLSAVNRYLRDPGLRESMVIKSVVTSSAIEGIRALFKRTTDGATPVRKRRLSQKKT